MRAVSVLMGLGTLIAAYLCGVELVGARRAALAPLALLLTPLFVYYGKTANLDIPSLCWFGFAMVAYVRILRGGGLRDYIRLGVAAAASVATKDQAYANLALLALAVVAITARRESAGRRILAAAAAALVASAIFHNLLFNFPGFVAHVRLLSTLGDLAIVPRTAAGYARLAGMTLALFRWSFGWPLFALTAFGVAGAVARAKRRWWLWLLAVPVSFFLFFTCVTRYVNDRYLFGGVFVLALFAGAAIADVLEASRWRPLARSIAAASCVYALLYAASIDVMMSLDARHATRRWVAANSGAETAVALVGGDYMPVVDPPARTVIVNGSVDAVIRAAPDLVVLNARLAGRFERASRPDGRVLLRALEEGTLGYDEVFRYRAPIPAWALLQYEGPIRGAEESLLTNLDKVNPEMVVYRRRP
jgi:4-amino-4-deoxy-L-arabinose transferase-like glycosyltransferase